VGSPPQAPRQKSPFKFVGLGCAVVLVLLALLAFNLNRSLTGPAGLAVPAAYVGEWQGQDGTTISIRRDGGGGFRMGAKRVSGGKVGLDATAKELTIGRFGIGHTWTVDQAPRRDAAGGADMKLDGTVYRRTGGDASASGSGLSGGSDFMTRDNSSGTVPSQDEMRVLVKKTLLDFNAALQKKDFTAFHGTFSTDFAEQFSPQQLRDVFKVFLDNKINIGVIKNLSATFQPQPSIDEEGVLNISGFYPTQPVRVHFEARYVWQNDEWKLLGLNVRLRRSAT
jgi:hypothetical protein